MPGAREALERHQVASGDLGERAVVDRHLEVRIGAHVAMAGEMLAHARHARGVEPACSASASTAITLGIRVQRAVADHARLAVVHVEHRREGEVHAVRLQLAADHEAAAARGGERLRRIAVPEPAQLATSAGIGGEAVAEALHAPALVVDGDERAAACAARGSNA